MTLWSWLTWAGAIAGQIILAVVLLGSGQWRRFYALTTLACWQSAGSLSLLTINGLVAARRVLIPMQQGMRSLNVVVDGQSEMKYLPLSVARAGDGISPVVPFADPAVVFQKLFPAPIGMDTRHSIIDAVSGGTR